MNIFIIFFFEIIRHYLSLIKTLQDHRRVESANLLGIILLKIKKTYLTNRHALNNLINSEGKFCLVPGPSLARLVQ